MSDLVTLAEAYRRFMLVDRSPATVKSYRQILDRLVAAIGPQRPVTAVTTEDLQHYLHQLRTRATKYSDHPRRPTERAPLSPATLTKILKTIRAFFNWCVRADLLAVSPAAALQLRRYSRPPGSSKAITPAELRILAKHVRRKRCHRERDYAVLLFLIDTGCRVGGCASLTLDRLHLHDRFAILNEKGDNLHRVCFGYETQMALSAWLRIRPAAAHRFVWVNQYGDPLAAAAIATMIRRAAQESLGKSLGPHCIRHRVGQSWADAGVPAPLVALKLGHHDTATTLDYYYNQDWSRLRAQSDQLALVALEDAPTAPAPVAVRAGVIEFPALRLVD